MKRVVVLDDYQGVAEEMADWASLRPDAEMTFFYDVETDADRLTERLAGVHAVCLMRERTPFPAGLLERLPDLELMVTTGMGNAAVDMDTAVANGVTVCGTQGNPHGAPELTWALLLALARRIPAEDAAVRAGGWQHTVGEQLHGRNLGLIGLGRIGRVVAGYGRAFGMPVIAWSENLTADVAAEHGAELVGRSELFERADVVSIHTRLGDRTRGLVGPDELARMKPTAWLINTSRGPIVQEQALLDALHGGTIAGAALDVYDVEPLPSDHPLRSAPNTVLTPHLGYVTRETYEVFYPQTVEALRAWLDGSPIRVIAAPD